MNFRATGKEIIEYYIRNVEEQFILDEKKELNIDFSSYSEMRVQLKDIDSKWCDLGRYERINKGKRFKEYVLNGDIVGVTIAKDEKNSPIEYFIH